MTRRGPFLLLIAFITSLLTLPAAAQQIRTDETIVVERVLIDARVTDSRGEPIRGLVPSDFVAKIDGIVSTVESVRWIPATLDERLKAGMDIEEAVAEPSEIVPEGGTPRGRLLVLFFQTDFARNKSRIGGQMHALPYVRKVLEGLEPADRVAVFSFDSHLKFRLDFTDDVEEIQRAAENALSIDHPPPPRVVANPSLARRLNRQEMRAATSSEEAFILVGNALRPIPGPKSIILFGWGLGQLVNGRIVMGPKYAIARQVLEAARVTVFSMDFSEADYHDLEIGLGAAAADTGGFYAKTFRFPQLAVDRLTKTLAGHYELEVRKPSTGHTGVHTIEVSVKRKGALVLAPATFTDK